jgi:hypothetical protein
VRAGKRGDPTLGWCELLGSNINCHIAAALLQVGVRGKFEARRVTGKAGHRLRA